MRRWSREEVKGERGRWSFDGRVRLAKNPRDLSTEGGWGPKKLQRAQKLEEGDDQDAKMELIRWWDEVLREVHRCGSGRPSPISQNHLTLHPPKCDENRHFQRQIEKDNVTNNRIMYRPWKCRWLGRSWLAIVACQWTVSWPYWHCTGGRDEQKKRPSWVTALITGQAVLGQSWTVVLPTTLIHLTQVGLIHWVSKPPIIR